MVGVCLQKTEVVISQRILRYLAEICSSFALLIITMTSLLGCDWSGLDKIWQADADCNVNDGKMKTETGNIIPTWRTFV